MPSVLIDRVTAREAALPRICVKTGVPTSDVVLLRGSAYPAWVNLLFPFTFIGFLLAGMMSSRGYRLAVPFHHVAHRRWKVLRRLAWLLAATGVCLAGAAMAGGWERPWMPLAVSLVGLHLGIVNAYVNNVGVRMGDGGGLRLTRVHPAFRDAALRQAAPVTVTS